MTKVQSKISKSFAVVTFGSEDNFDMPNDREYKAMLDRLNEIGRPDDIASLPLLIAGNKTVRLRVQRIVLKENEKLSFERGRSRKAPKDPGTDKFIRRASTQLDMVLSQGKPQFILVPYYSKVVVKKV